MSDVIIVPTAMYGNHSKWKQRELEYAKRTCKSILAVNPWGQEQKSADIISLAEQVAGWNKDSLVNAVWNLRWTKARRS
jgi:hypothetical protein